MESPHSGEDSTEREVAWFRTHRATVLPAVRRVAAMYHRLDAAMTVAHALGVGSAAALVVKYEVEDGVVDDLEQFRRDALSSAVDGAPRLTRIRLMLDVTLENLDQNKIALTRSGSTSTSELQSLLWQFRDMHCLMQALIDDILPLILAR